MYPLKFEPIFKTIVWGGEKIAPYKGVETEQEHIGESWELSGVKGNESVVANGALKGRTIADLVKEYKGRLVGEHVYANTGDEFPLLIKFIDALSDLSVQVHPNDELAAVRHNGSKGKTEMWYVVDAEPGAHLLAGMTEEITPEEYEKRVADGTITEVLARHDVHPGDVFFLPAGRIHVGLDGKPRQLHTELAKDAIDYKVYPDYRTAYTPAKDAETELVSCKYFTTSLYEMDQAVTKNLEDVDSFLVVMCLAGSGTLTDAEPVYDAEGRRGPTKGHVIDLRQGETVLVPATRRHLQARRGRHEGHHELHQVAD